MCAIKMLKINWENCLLQVAYCEIPHFAYCVNKYFKLMADL